MTELQQIEKNIAECKTMIADWDALEKALGSKHGKHILAILRKGKEASAELTTNASADLRDSGLLGVQSVVWAEQHFDYTRQFAVQAESALEELIQLREDIVSGVTAELVDVE